jgi:4,4'-diaponeurosporenoate glycosyltransferase
MQAAALVLGIVLAAQQALFWLLGFFFLWRIPRCRAAANGGAEPTVPGSRQAGAGPARPRISVIIPARNEERTLPALLASLAAQERGADEIIVVDDGSQDATAAIASRQGVRVLTPGPKPEEWMGKSWACWHGAQAATGEVFVFLDADTTLAPGGLAALEAAHARDGGLVGVQPYHAIRRPYEALAAVFNLVVVAGLNAFSLRGRRLAPAGSFGPCMVCGRSDYFAAGGHVAVKTAIVEDMALGMRFRAAGVPVTCYGGRGTVSFRMYPDGLASLVEGFTKNMVIGASEIRPIFKVMIALWLTGITVCTFSTLLSLLPWFAVLRPIQAAFYLLYAAQMYWMLRRVGSFGPLTAILFPVPLVFFHIVYFRSVHIVRSTTTVTWKGRRISMPGREGRNGS